MKSFYLLKGFHMTPSHCRHDISDKVWSLLEEHLPGREGAWGDNQEMNRARKGAQHQDTSGRGCAWYAAQNPCYTRYHC
ncbi:hypothetical protein SAMN05216318_12822 [Nitrosomonas eutropha]|nr:hypothetical protein SAMN05216318_12822 [Nitrosomonas eutropha]